MEIGICIGKFVRALPSDKVASVSPQQKRGRPRSNAFCEVGNVPVHFPRLLKMHRGMSHLKCLLPVHFPRAFLNPNASMGWEMSRCTFPGSKNASGHFST